jgi:hypothetical protein
MDQHPTLRSRSGLLGVGVLCLLIAAGAALLVVNQRQHHAGARFRFAAPFPAPCSSDAGRFRCYDIRVTNEGDLAGTVVCSVTDAGAAATFVNGERTYRSVPIEAGRQVFVIVQVEDPSGGDTGAAPAPDASCSASPAS